MMKNVFLRFVANKTQKASPFYLINYQLHSSKANVGNI